MCFLNRLLLIALLLLESAAWVPGIERTSYFSLRFFAAFLALCNASIRPLLLLSSIKINIYTSAAAAFIMNALIFYLADQYYFGIHIVSISGGTIAFLVIWISSTLANRYIYMNLPE